MLSEQKPRFPVIPIVMGVPETLYAVMMGEPLTL
jgi:hypothetical protein